MNKIIKVSLAILGGCNEVMGLFIPIAIALLWLIVFGAGFGSYIIIGVASLATLFRGLKPWIK